MMENQAPSKPAQNNALCSVAIPMPVHWLDFISQRDERPHNLHRLAVLIMPWQVRVIPDKKECVPVIPDKKGCMVH